MVRFLCIKRKGRTSTNSRSRTEIKTRDKSTFNLETLFTPSSQSRWSFIPVNKLIIVEHSLPKKREYILYAPLTVEQNELYQSILDKDIRAFLENKHLSRATSGTVTPRKRKSESPDEEEETSTATSPRTRSQVSTPNMSRSSSMRSVRKKQRTSYREMTDSEWYSAMEKAEKEQFNEDYTPSPEVLKLTSTRNPALSACS